MSTTVASIVHYDLNIYAAFFSVAILITMHTRRNTVGFGTRLFRRILIATLALSLLEIASWLFDERSGQLARILNYLFNWIYLWLNPLAPCLWAAYIDYQIYESRERLRRRWYYLYPMVVSTLIMVVTPFYPLVFSVSPENVYQREWGLWILFVVSAGMFVFLLVFASRNRDRDHNKIIPVLLALVTAPVLGSLAEMLLYGMMLIWPLMTMVVVIAYVFLENHNASIDNLTGLFTRLRAEEYIRNLVESRTPFTLVSLDLDNFKLINDRYGHLEGDRALVRFSETLKRLCGKGMMVARFGGDEFVVVTRETDEALITAKIKEVNEYLKTGNSNDGFNRPLGASAGFAIYDPAENWSIDQLFATVDERMYENKSSRKNLHRRRSDRIKT